MCFSGACMQGKWRRCANKSHVEAWKYHLIEPKEDEEDSDDEGLDDAAYEVHHDFLSDALSVGDNFAAVNAGLIMKKVLTFTFSSAFQRKNMLERQQKPVGGMLLMQILMW